MHSNASKSGLTHCLAFGDYPGSISLISIENGKWTSSYVLTTSSPKLWTQSTIGVGGREAGMWVLLSIGR